MTYNLDEYEEALTQGPNPPQWWIHYVNDQGTDPHWYDGVLPEAHTHDLAKVNEVEMQIRLAPPNVAAAVLDRIGLWMTWKGSGIQLGDVLIVYGVEYTVTPAFDSEGEPVHRLAWERDPVKDRDEVFIKRFNEAKLVRRDNS